MSGGGVWVTGAGGLLGSWLVRTAPAALRGQVVGLTRRDLDLLDFAGLKREFRREAPRLVVHCAALSRSPECQANPVLAEQLNVEVTSVLAELAAETPLIFFSTDLVFDGQTGNYSESAPVNPLSVYAQTKVRAERIVLANPKHTVVRTSLNCGASPTGDRGLDEQLRRAWQAGQTLKLFTDEFRCPIAAEATARAVWELAERGATGIFHVAGSQRLSRWEIGQLLAKRWPELNARLEPASLKEYPGAVRSPDTSLNCAKAQRLLSFPLPRFSDYVAEALPKG